MATIDDTAVHPFRIEVPQADLDRLAARLADVRLPEPLPGDDWDTGVPTAYLRDLVEHWRTAYDCGRRSARSTSSRSSSRRSTAS